VKVQKHMKTTLEGWGFSAEVRSEWGLIGAFSRGQLDCAGTLEAATDSKGELAIDARIE